MIDVDTSELLHAARAFADVDPRTTREMPRIMRRAGVNVRDDWRADAARSKWFHQIGSTVTFDERDAFGSYEVEIGPDRRRRAARLAGIWIFGGANGGGGTGTDPQRFADTEAPKLEKAIADLVDKVLS